jgi:hypothetical protein
MSSFFSLTWALMYSSPVVPPCTPSRLPASSSRVLTSLPVSTASAWVASK